MFTSIWEDIKQQFSYGNTLTRIILVNVAVFVVVTLVRLILMPATVEDGESLVNMLSLPALSITPNELASSADADSELTPWTEAKPPRLLHRSPKRKRNAPDPLLADETALFRFPQQVRVV